MAEHKSVILCTLLQELNGSRRSNYSQITDVLHFNFQGQTVEILLFYNYSKSVELKRHFGVHLPVDKGHYDVKRQ